MRKHGTFDNLGGEEGEGDGCILGRVERFELQIDVEPASVVGSAAAQAGGEFTDERTQRDTAVLLQLRIMVAVNYRERVLGYTQAFSSLGGLMVAFVIVLCIDTRKK